MKNPLFILTFIAGGNIEKHILTHSKDRVRKEILEHAKSYAFKLSDNESDIYELVNEIKEQNGMSSFEIHLEEGEIED